MSFTSLGLSNLLSETINTIHSTPTSLQRQAIPVALQGSDLIVTAPAGVGKLASFILPVLEQASRSSDDVSIATKKQIQVLILVSTATQAIRVADYCNAYGINLPITTGCLVTKVSKTPQIKIIENGVDILIACPERLVEIINETTVDFSGLKTLVLDDADKLLDHPQLAQISSLIPEQHQTLLFSEKHTHKIYEFSNNSLSNPTQINLITDSSDSTPLIADSIEQAIYYIPNRQKAALLAHLIQHKNWQQIFVFIRTKHCANQLAGYLEKKGITVSIINNSVNVQADNINDHLFNLSAQVILAIDTVIPKLDNTKFPCIVNFDLPFIESDYILRTNCTTDTGCAISFVSPEEEKLLLVVERFINQKIADGDLLGFVFDESEMAEQETDRFRRIFRHPAVGRKSRKKATKHDISPSTPNDNIDKNIDVAQSSLVVDLSEEGSSSDTIQKQHRNTKQTKSTSTTTRKKNNTGLYNRRKKTTVADPALDLPPDRQDDEFRDDDYDNFGNSVDYVSPYASKEKRITTGKATLANKRPAKTVASKPKATTTTSKPKTVKTHKNSQVQEAKSSRNSLYRRKPTRTKGYSSLETSAMLPEPSEYTQKRSTTAPAIILRKHSRLDKLPTIEQLDSLPNRHITRSEKPALLTKKTHDD